MGMPIYLAAIDIGSHAIRMVIGRIETETHQLILINSSRKFVRLGQSVFETGMVTEDYQERLLEVLRGFKKKINAFPQTQIFAVATSAMRDAQNQREVVKKIQEKIGISIHIISGNQEADYITHGVQSCVDWGSESAILADLGGGSLEISIFDGPHLSFRKSFDWGTLRLIQWMKQYRHSEWELPGYLDGLIEELRTSLQGIPFKADHFILTGGTAKVIARMSHQLYQSPMDPNFFKFQWTDFQNIKLRLLETPLIQLVMQGEFSRDRMDVILPATFVFNALGMAAGNPSITVPMASLKEGVLVSVAKHQFSMNPLSLVLKKGG